MSQKMSLFTKKILSLHPRLAAGFDVVFGLVLVWWLLRLTAVWAVPLWFGFRAVWWGGLILLVYCAPGVSRFRQWLTLVVGNIGLGMLLLVVDWPLGRYAAEALFIFMPAVSFWLLPTGVSELSFAIKPERRWRLLLSVLGLFGIWSGGVAFSLFQLLPPHYWWVSWVVSAAVASAMAGWWWFEYGLPFNRQLWLWMVAMAVLLVEFSGITWWLPWGYLVTGWLLTWVWYLLWLLIRFQVSSEGVNWEKQRWFLLANAVLLALFVGFVARWR